MTSSKLIQSLVAGAAAFALVGTALAQGTAANPAVKNPATGAGQQSTQNTPMGTTGTPGGSGTMATGTGVTSGSTMSGSTNTAPMNSGTAAAARSSGSTSGTSMGSTSAGAGTDMASTGGKRSTRRPRADRN